ncbi:MAG: lipopolysaccharide export system permease protein [Halioglobus sp.]|jgi:lipopolysaccharide export system permease protein
MTRIDSYISSSFLRGCLPVLALLLTLFGILALSEELENVGEGAYELSDALIVVAYTMPALIVSLLPVTALLGGLLGLGTLANNLELVSLRAAAVSPVRIAVPIVKIALLLIALVLLLQNFVIPRVEYSAAQHRAKTLLTPTQIGYEEPPKAFSDKEFWTRSRGQFIRIGAMSADRSLADVEIYQFEADGNLSMLLQSPRADLLQNNTWLLHNVQQTRVSTQRSQTEHKVSVVFESLLNEKETQALIIPASSLSPPDLWRSIRRLEENNMNAKTQKILFWSQISVPVGLLGMALLSLPFLLGSTRSVPVGQRITMGAIIGIVYYLVQQISGHLSGLLPVHVAVTVLAPGLLILLVALYLLRRASTR